MASTPGSGINKNLLTPCRRMGLSRKRKTPNSIVKIPSYDLNCSNTSINNSPIIDTTPVNHRKSFNRRDHTSFRQIPSSSSPLTILATSSGTEEQLKTELESLQESNGNNKSKKGLFGQFSSEDLFDSTKHVFSPKNVATGISRNCSKDNPIEKLKKTFSSEESVSTKNSIDEKGGESPLACSLEVINTKVARKCIRRLSDDDFLENTPVKTNKLNKPKEVSSFNVESEVMIDDSDEDSKIIGKYDSKRKQQKVEDNKFTKRTKRIKKTLSMKKSSLSFSNDEFETDIPKKVVNSDDSIKECKIQIQKLSEDSIQLSETTANKIDKSVEKLVMKRTILDDDDDDDAFTFTPEQEKTEKKNLKQKIKALEDKIKQKQQKFANLKRASIYKNKHNVEGLKQLTSQWVNGCVLGLNDLLGQLQAHGPMSMTTLVNNLHISNELLAKLPLNLE